MTLLKVVKTHKHIADNELIVKEDKIIPCHCNMELIDI